MAHALNSLRQSARNLAHRAGLSRFWRWWSDELTPLIPAAWRGAMRRRLTRPVVEFGDGEAIFWRPQVIDGSLRLVEVARVALVGDGGEVAAAGRAAVNAVAISADGEIAAAPKVVIALPPRQVMRKTLVLPAAVEENLVQALSYDLDRHTPFRPEQLYFDAAVVNINPAAKTIGVDWVAALKTAVDSVRRQVEDWGAIVVAVVPGPVATNVARATKLNLVPQDARAPSAPWRRWRVWGPVAVLAAAALAVLVVPLVQKREYAIALNKQTESARVQAEGADALRTQLERQQGDYNYALARKYSYPGTVQIVDDITRLLPDDTWLTQLEMRSVVRGKDNARELSLRGESANAGALISTLEESKLVEQAALQSPTTKLQPGPGEVFVLGSRLRSGTPPDPVPVAATPAAAAPDAAPSAEAPAGPPGASSSTAPGAAPAAAVPSTGALPAPAPGGAAPKADSPASVTFGIAPPAAIAPAPGAATSAPMTVGGRP